MERWIRFLIDYIGDMADLVGTSNVNVHVDRRHKVKTLFRGRRRMTEDRQDEGRFIPGVGKVRILPMEYED